MAGTKRDRQRQARLAKQAALEAARRRAALKRRAVFMGIGAVAVVLIAVLLTRGGDKKKTVATSNTSSTIASTATTAASPDTTVAGNSAAGKPCVKVADPLPAGAPAVPVKEGPPPTELVKEDLKPGTGATVTPGATVTVNYIGVSCSTGKIFDSSYKAGGKPISFSLNGVIKGWTDGIPGMKVGGQRLLGIPPAQGYGSSGQGATIGPDETLWFVVEVTDTKAA